MRAIPVFLLFAIFMGAGLDASEYMGLPADVRKAFDDPSKIILYSIEPVKVSGLQRIFYTHFHGFIVLGQIELDQQQGAIAITAFKSAMSMDDPGIIAMCFNPRHALRITANEHQYDFLLCYECRRIYLYKDDKFLTSLYAEGSPKVLNELLIAADIPLSKTGDRN